LEEEKFQEEDQDKTFQMKLGEVNVKIFICFNEGVILNNACASFWLAFQSVSLLIL